MSIAYFIARRLRQIARRGFTHIVHQIGIVSVALGLATTLIAFSVMEGFQQNITHKLTGLGGDIQVVKYSSNKTPEEPPWDRKKLKGLQAHFSTTIKAVKAFAHKTILVQSADEIEGILCKGLDAKANYENLRCHLTEGRLVDLSGPKYCHEVVLSTHTAARLRVRVGDELVGCVLQKQPRYRKLTIVGLYATHVADLDKQLAFCDLRLIQRLNDWPDDWVGGYEIFLKDHQEIQPVIEQLKGWVDYDLGLKTTKHTHAVLFDWLHVMKTNAVILTGLILLVMCTNLVSIVLIQMMERATMIGILKTLGATNKQIGCTMLWSNSYMVIQGILWGNGIAIAVYILQHYTQVIALDPAYYHIDHLPMTWDWYMFLRFNALTLAIVLTTLLVSMMVIVRLKPVKALKP